MGIREYFKQHPEGEDLKLQNIIIKESAKKPEDLFNPEEEISDEKWQEMLEHLQRLRDVFLRDFKTTEALYYSRMARNMKLLFPEREADLKLDEVIAKKLERVVSGGYFGFDYPNIVEAFKILFPERFKRLNITEIFRQIGTQMNFCYEHKITRELTEILECLKVVDSVPLLQKELEDCWRNINIDYNILKHSNWVENYYKLIIFLSKIKIFYLEKFEIIRNETKDDDLLYYFRNQKRNPFEFSQLAAALKIIFAEKIEITDDGMEIIMPRQKEDHKIIQSKRPERRAF